MGLIWDDVWGFDPWSTGRPDWRKKGIAISFVLFTTATLLTGFASSPEHFKIFRFIAGLGCGGLMPNAVALMNEYAPKRMRGTMVALMFSGYSVGGMVAAGLGIGLIPNFGWQPMFFVAAIPLLLLPLILWKLPESLGFLIRQGKQDEAKRIFAKSTLPRLWLKMTGCSSLRPRAPRLPSQSCSVMAEHSVH